MYSGLYVGIYVVSISICILFVVFFFFRRVCSGVFGGFIGQNGRYSLHIALLSCCSIVCIVCLFCLMLASSFRNIFSSSALMLLLVEKSAGRFMRCRVCFMCVRGAFLGRSYVEIVLFFHRSLRTMFARECSFSVFIL